MTSLTTAPPVLSPAPSLATRPAEVNGGTTTPWLPMTSPVFTLADAAATSACASAIWRIGPAALAAWDPGYGLSVSFDDGNPTATVPPPCHPPQITSWWDAEHLGVDVRATQWSLGPVVCPSPYRTGSTSVNKQSSTLVGCCPR